MKRTVKIADYGTQRDIKFCAEGNSAKLDGITTFLEYGGITGNPEYGLAAIKAGIDAAKQSVSTGKAKVANALAAKGIGTAADATFDTIAANINKITTLSQGTQDATAGAGQILSGYTAYVKGGKVTGTIPSQGAQTIMPGTSAKTIAAGRYLSGQQTIAGDVNLIPANIAEGKSIFGVAGAFAGGNGFHVSLEWTQKNDGSGKVRVPEYTSNLDFAPSGAVLICKAFLVSPQGALNNVSIRGFAWQADSSYSYMPAGIQYNANTSPNPSGNGNCMVLAPALAINVYVRRDTKKVMLTTGDANNGNLIDDPWFYLSLYRPSGMPSSVITKGKWDLDLYVF